MNNYVNIEIPSSSVASDLISFPMLVNLSALSQDSFWGKVYYYDGSDIRVTDNNNIDLPFDLVFFDKNISIGSLFVKLNLSSSSNTNIRIHYGDSSKLSVPVTDSNGRNAVWSNYHRVYFFSPYDFYANHCDNAGYTSYTGLIRSYNYKLVSPEVYSHQGICSDGYYFYTTDTNAIYKWDYGWNLKASNANPCGDVGSSVNHCGDPDIHDGVIYVPIEKDYLTPTYQKIAKFRATDLVYLGSVSISAQSHECSSLCIIPEDDIVYVASFNDGSKIWKYSLIDLSYIGYIPLSSTIPTIQGITFFDNCFHINSDTTTIDKTVIVTKDGTVGPSVSHPLTQSNTYEGICVYRNKLLTIFSTGEGQGKVYELTPIDFISSSGIKMYDGSLKYSSSRYTEWTIGLSVNFTEFVQTRIACSYGVAGTDSTKRSSLGYRISTNQFGLWNATDGWLFSAVTPTLDKTYRFNIVHNGTTYRKLYTDSVVATDTGCTEQPVTGANTLYFGSEDEAYTQYLRGYVGFFYLINSILPQEWITAEYNNLKCPEAFYNVVSYVLGSDITVNPSIVIF